MKPQTILLVALLVIGQSLNLFAQHPITPDPPDKGDGSSGNPFQIETLNHLYWIAVETRAERDFAGEYFLQTDDIDAAASENWFGGDGWLPIGIFQGNYDGGGHTISNLHIDRADEGYVGLFGIISNASISNLGVIDASITGGNITGGIVGDAYNSEISNCFFSGTITGSQIIGGIVGYSWNLEIHNSYNLGNLHGTNYIGGLVGQPFKSIETTHSYSAGSINLSKEGQKSKNTFMGGLIGVIDPHGSVSITHSYFDKDKFGLDVPIDEEIEGITGKTTAEMKKINTFYGSGWGIAGDPDIKIDYPFLAWEDDNSKGLVWKIGTGEPAGDEPDDEEDGIYLIETWQHLLWISQNSDTWGDNFRQIDDIDFADVIEDGYPEIQYWNDGKGWSPIGTASVYKNDKTGLDPFTGNYDGGGFEIRNLFIDQIGIFYGNGRQKDDDEKNGEYGEFFVGLFGVVEDAEISNIRLVDALVVGNPVVGGIAGVVAGDAEISHIQLVNPVIASISQNAIVGGIAGITIEGINGNAGSPEISNCSVSFDQDVESAIIGFAEDNKVKGDGIFEGAAGGIVGHMNAGKIKESCNEVTIVGLGLKGVGGLAGGLGSGSIENSYNIGAVAPFSYNVGGLVGFGGVPDGGPPEVKFQGGPLKGDGSVQITNSYSAGTFSTDIILGSTNDFSRINTSGFENLGNSLREQFLNRPAQPKEDQRIGGVIGYLEGVGTIGNCFFDKEAADPDRQFWDENVTGVIGKNTAKMMDPETYEAWGDDIEENENIEKGYPFLFWELAQTGTKNPVWIIGTGDPVAVPLSNTALYLSLALIAGFVFFRIHHIR